MHSDASITGNRSLGLFANTMFEGLGVFGERLYKLTLHDYAKIQEIPDDLRQPGRCAAYYAGVRDLAQHLGIDAVRVTHETDIISLVVLNFDAIATWEYEGESV